MTMALFTPILVRMADTARDRRDWPRAERIYRRVLRGAPQLPGVWVQLGHMLKEQGDPIAALEAYRQAKALAPKRADTHHQIGRMLHRLGRFAQAARAYDRALALAPALRDAQTERAALWTARLTMADQARDRRDWARAEALYREVLDHDPALAAIWVQRGHCAKELGNITAALEAYRRAEALAPEVADTQHQIARALWLTGQVDEAIARYDRVLALAPWMDDAARERDRLHQARGDARHAPIPVLLDRDRPAGLPTHLRYVILGTTGLCNASCIHCPTGKAETSHVPRVPMAMDLFRRIVDQIADLRLPITDQVAFGLFGDALIDPFVVERARYLMDRLPQAKISINTNGAAFHADRHAVLNNYAATVALHCESLTPETYDYLMQPLRAERVHPRYAPLLQAYPGKVVVSVPVSRRNVAELPAIRAWFLDHGARDVVFDPLSSRCAEDRTLFDTLALKPRPIRCSAEMVEDLIVDCDGQVLICCQDFKRVEGIGSLREESLAEALVGARRARVRAILDEGRHGELQTCRRCFGDHRVDLDQAVREVLHQQDTVA
jgi:Tfp pilus assembly protein PilF/MoaA/NifB/PqqE/SkfB family radical SAM enzyme